MTGQADFTPEEWELVLEGPAAAGLIVAGAQSGGTIKEAYALAKAYVEARQQHGESQLLDELAATKPHLDHKRFHSYDELRQQGLARLKSAVELLDQKASADEVEDYRRFVLNVSNMVAGAHKEDGVSVTDAERAAIDEVATALGSPVH